MPVINLAHRLYVDDDGTSCAITNMYDEDGEETEDASECVAFVAKRSESEWIADDARLYDMTDRA